MTTGFVACRDIYYNSNGFEKVRPHLFTKTKRGRHYAHPSRLTEEISE
jgi:hypothetical protein